MKYVLASEDMNALNQDQKVAIMEALLTAVVADGRAKPDEIAVFDQEVDRIPWNIERPQLKTLMEAARQRVLALKDQRKALDFIASVATRLPSQGLREKVFRSMLSVMVADDKLTPEEKHVVVAFATSFGLPVGKLDEIRADLGH